MPIYEYRCEKGHTFEVIQRMADDPITTCEVCSRPVERVFHPIAVHFKGSGFYNTDYGTRKRGRDTQSGEGGGDGGGDKTGGEKGGSEKGGEKTSEKSGEGKASGGKSDSPSPAKSDTKTSEPAKSAKK